MKLDRKDVGSIVLLTLAFLGMICAVVIGVLEGPTLYTLHIDDDIIENVTQYHVEHFGVVSYKQDEQWYSRRYSSFYAVKQKGKV